MYCPYCKNQLILKNNEYYCDQGDAYFSKNISDFFERETSFQEDVNKDIKEKGRLYCVKCGVNMLKSKEMHEVCPVCHFEINKARYYEIIELNPHQDTLYDIESYILAMVKYKFKNIHLIDNRNYDNNKLEITYFKDNYYLSVSILSNYTYDMIILREENEKWIMNKTINFNDSCSLLNVIIDDIQSFNNLT